MPLLKREPDLFPQGLFDLPIESHPWWVAHVKSRQEKALARLLQPRGVPYYLPQREQKIRRSGRNFVSYLPLFPGYLFFRGTDDDRHLALRSNLVAQVIDVVDQPLLDAELGRLRALQESGLPLVSHPYIEPGSAVSITDGPFRGYEGIVIRAKGLLRIVVSVSMLRTSFTVELDREALALLAARVETFGCVSGMARLPPGRGEMRRSLFEASDGRVRS
jgi:transcription antitermination factor NusG